MDGHSTNTTVSDESSRVLLEHAAVAEVMPRPVLKPPPQQGLNLGQVLDPVSRVVLDHGLIGKKPQHVRGIGEHRRAQ